MTDDERVDDRSGEELEDPDFSRSPTGLVGSSPRPRNPGTASLTAFVPGDVISERYEVIRFVAKGGMGEVYEVDDRALQQRVALKTIRIDAEANEEIVERFRREINLSRQVTHPNICRIFDLGFHRFEAEGNAGARSSEIMFLTMEFIEGETLSDRIRSLGRMNTATALPLVEQIAAGLDAAHEAAILHRDLKSANVMLTRSNSKRYPERVVITDFGLARSVGEDSSLAALTRTGHVAGTPLYMAPEQVEGGELTTAVDVYSFGIVMYEMLTGARPFDGGSPLSVAARKLKEEPPPPVELVPDLDPRWNDAIVRCLEIDPARRPASVADVIRLLHVSAVDTEARTVSTPREPQVAAPRASGPGGRPRLLRRGSVILALLVAAVAGGWLGVTAWRDWRSQGRTLDASATVEPRRALAVLDFKNNRGDEETAWLSTAISEILTTELGVGNEVRVIRGNDVASLRVDLGLEEIVDPDPALLERIRRVLAADLVVSGSYSRLDAGEGNLIRVDLRLFETDTGHLIAESGTTGSEAQLFTVIERSSVALREALGIGRLSPTEALQAEAALPADPIAAKLFSQGISKARQYDYTAARGLLAQAVDIEPDHAVPRAELARALSALGYGEEAEEQANKAAELAGPLPRSLRLAIEARAAAIGGRHDQAAGAYSHLFELFPDDIELGLELARSQAIAGRPLESLATLDGLRRLPPPTGDDPRIDLRAASARRYLGELEAALKDARSAAEKAEASGLTHVAAQARQLAGELLHTLGDPAQAMTMLEEARKLYASVKDLTGVAECLQGMALVLEDRGDLEGATRLLERVLEMHRQTGSGIGAARALHSLGNLAVARGSLGEARSFFEKALTTFEANHAADETAASLNGLGVVLHLEGDLDGATQKYFEALEVYESIGDKPSTALILTNLAEISYLQGDLASAKRMHEDALALNREVGDTYGVAYDTYRLGMVFFELGDLLVARGRFEEAIELQDGLADRLGASMTKIMLARVDLAEGAYGAAARRAESAGQILGAEGNVDGEMLARAVRVESLVAVKDDEGASPLAARLRADVTAVTDPKVRAAMVSAFARYVAQAGDRGALSDSRVELNALITELTDLGLVPPRFEALLALAEVEIAAGDNDAAEERLNDLSAEARAKGFERIAKRASKLAAK